MAPLFNLCFSVFTWARLACEVAFFVASHKLVIIAAAAQALSLCDDKSSHGMFDTVRSSIACGSAPSFATCDTVQSLVACDTVPRWVDHSTVPNLVACDTVSSPVACDIV